MVVVSYVCTSTTTSCPRTLQQRLGHHVSFPSKVKVCLDLGTKWVDWDIGLQSHLHHHSILYRGPEKKMITNKTNALDTSQQKYFEETLNSDESGWHLLFKDKLWLLKLKAFGKWAGTSLFIFSASVLTQRQALAEWWFQPSHPGLRLELVQLGSSHLHGDHTQHLKSTNVSTQSSSSLLCGQSQAEVAGNHQVLDT